MKRLLIVLLFFGSSPQLRAQPNCAALLYYGDTAAYEACQFLETALNSHYQYEEEFQRICDSALKICGHFAYAWREKSTPYVKSGNFHLWLKYMNEAVRYDSLEMLPARASCRGKFFADYAGAIADIELFERKYPGSLAMAHNGTYSLQMVKALSYRALGNREEAVRTAENYLRAYPNNVGMYDRLHLGVMYFELGRHAEAKKQLKAQLLQSPVAEAAYQIAKIAKSEKKDAEAKKYIQHARELFNAGQQLFDPYHYLDDQLFEAELIEAERL
jgi:tetratricopeptide (TPR) repeat protein